MAARVNSVLNKRVKIVFMFSVLSEIFCYSIPLFPNSCHVVQEKVKGLIQQY
jgi:hypothetical protein